MCDANATSAASSGNSAPAGAPAAASTPIPIDGILRDAPTLAAVATPASCAQASLKQQINTLKNEQKAARDARKVLNKTLKNALGCKTRLQKARQLSNEDLVAVLTMREENDSRSAASHTEHSDEHEEDDASEDP